MALLKQAPPEKGVKNTPPFFVIVQSTETTTPIHHNVPEGRKHCPSRTLTSSQSARLGRVHSKGMNEAENHALVVPISGKRANGHNVFNDFLTSSTLGDIGNSFTPSAEG
jgi:hypothetical protein